MNWKRRSGKGSGLESRNQKRASLTDSRSLSVCYWPRVTLPSWPQHRVLLPRANVFATRAAWRTFRSKLCGIKIDRSFFRPTIRRIRKIKIPSNVSRYIAYHFDKKSNRRSNTMQQNFIYPNNSCIIKIRRSIPPNIISSIRNFVVFQGFNEGPIKFSDKWSFVEMENWFEK